jgi:hypothetical protein
MNNFSNSLMRLAVVLGVGSAPLFAGFEPPPAVIPEPSLLALTAVGVGAVILIARKKRNR